MGDTHFIVEANWQSGIETFACERVQRMGDLDATYDPSRVTCLACLKRMKPPYVTGHLSST